MKSTNKISITAEGDHPRVDRYLVSVFPEFSRSRLEKLFKGEKIRINGTVSRKRSTAIRNGDRIDIEPVMESADFPVTDTTLVILYEDPYLMVINKPHGIAVHPGAGKREETIMDILIRKYPQVGDIPDTDRPGIVHRLDKETSGVLILAKDSLTMKKLQKKFKRREIHKEYLALVNGHVRFDNGTIDEPIVRNPRYRKKFMVPSEPSEDARDAITRYTVLERLHRATYLRIMPLTGRTHQIRVHFSFLGNPVLGDRLYGDEKKFSRLALHAHRLNFTHPITETAIDIEAVIPVEFNEYLERHREG